MAIAHPDEKAAQVASPHHDPESGPGSISLDKDEAIGLVGVHAQEIDPVVEARVLRKIDWFLIPAMIIGTYTFTAYPHLNSRNTFAKRQQAMD
jgi:hypothetical protein